MRRLLIRPEARLDLLEIWHAIAADNVPAAHRMIGKLDAGMKGLLDMPGKGHVRRDVRDTRYRFWAVRPYIIAYRFDTETLTVVRVLHGHRDFRSLFDREAQ